MADDDTKPGKAGPPWVQIAIAIIGLVGSLGASWILASKTAKTAEAIAEAKLSQATNNAIDRINAVADSRTAEVAVVYRLQNRVQINMKHGDPAFHLDFSEKEQDLNPQTVQPGSGAWAFTAPHPGEYAVTASVGLNHSDPPGAPFQNPEADAFFILFKNGREVGYFGHYVGTSNKGLHPAGMTTVKLDKGDKLHLGLKYSNVPSNQQWGTTDSRDHTFISIVRTSSR